MPESRKSVYKVGKITRYLKHYVLGLFDGGAITDFDYYEKTLEIMHNGLKPNIKARLAAEYDARKTKEYEYGKDGITWVPVKPGAKKTK
ncbi:MAG: hypothetical protein V1887_04090 [Candidatus Aenigmatarchaeota archaeon]